MNIFLTGGTGFIGSNFIKLALEEGHVIYAIKRVGSFPKIEFTNQPYWVEGNLDSDYSKVLKNCDVLVHLAAYGLTGRGEESWQDALNCNVVLTLKLFESAFSSGIKKFFLAGSGIEYGKTCDRYKKIPVNAPLEPIDAYSSTKAAASILLQGWGVNKKVKLHILRLFQVYGEGEPSYRLFPSLKRAAENGLDFNMTPGKQLRDFIDVKEVSRILLDTICSDDLEFGKPLITNVGSGQPQTLLQFCTKFWKEFNAKGKLKPGSVNYRSDEIMRLVPEVIKKDKSN